MDGLIVKDPYVGWILGGEKTVELRGGNTNKRGTIALIQSGTNKVYGTVDIVDTFLIETKNQYEKLRPRHCLGIERREIHYKKLWGWVLENPVCFKEPVPYEHKLGQQIWVKNAL